MRKKIKIIIVPVLMMLASTSLAQHKPTVKVALINTFSAADPMCYDRYIEGFEKAINMAWEDYKDKTPAIDFDVKFVKYDYEANKLLAGAAMRQAADNGVIASIGYMCSDYALLGGKVAQELRVPLITPTATTDEIEKIGDYVYMASAKNSYQGEILAQFAFNDIRRRNTLIITAIDCSYCVSLADAYKKTFTKLGGRISAELHILGGDSNFADIVINAVKYDFDSVFIPNYDIQSFGILNEFLRQNINTTFLGGDGWNWKGKSHDIIGSDKFLAYTVVSWLPENEGKILSDFTKRFVKRFNAEPYVVAAHSYDSAMILFDAISKLKHFDREALNKVLANTKSYKGVTGEFRYDGKGSPKKIIFILKVGKNEYKVAKVVNPR